jgi:hypothetical protein
MFLEKIQQQQNLKELMRLTLINILNAKGVIYNYYKQQQERKQMETKRSWWSLTIQDYPNYKPSDADLDHIAEMIKQGYDQGELIQENEDEE